MVSVPLCMGAATLTLAVAIGQTFGFLGFMGLCGVLLGVGIAATDLLLHAENLGRRALAELLTESENSETSRLRDLAHRLSEDGDTRTRAFLTALQRNYLRLHDDSIVRGGPRTALFPEIQGQAEALYESCLGSIERSITFWQAAQQMATSGARDELLNSREELMAEISASIECLGRTLDQLQIAAVRDGGQVDLAGIRQELEAGLEVARKVDLRMKTFEQGLSDRPPTRLIEE